MRHGGKVSRAGWVLGWCLAMALGVGCAGPVAAEEAAGVASGGGDETVEAHGWRPPAARGDDDHTLGFTAQSAYGEERGRTASVFGFLDLSASRKLDEQPWSARALVRFLKDASSSDEVKTVELREARIDYGTSRFQGVLGRMDLQPTLSPLSFFGAAPLMGARRADAVMATVPVFFKLGDREDVSGASAPLALNLLYCPSLLSAEMARMDQSQGFFLGQARARLGTETQKVVLRVAGGKTRSDLFDYSSLSGDPFVSGSVEYVTNRFFALSGEWGTQNLSHARETSVAAAGIRFERIATSGPFSLDGVWVEGQFPVKGCSQNVFTGGDAYDAARSVPAKPCWYVRVRGRLGLLEWEIQSTNNRDDYTLGRVSGPTLSPGLPEKIGPGRLGGDALLPLKTDDSKIPVVLARVGVPF